MEAGNVMASGGPGLFFLPAGEPLYDDLFLDVSGIEKRGGMVLDGPHLTRFHTLSVPADICRECRKIVMEY